MCHRFFADAGRCFPGLWDTAEPAIDLVVLDERGLLSAFDAFVATRGDVTFL